jgi:hypothetical protein
MPANSLSRMRRRTFLKLAGAATAVSVTQRTFSSSSQRISVIVDADDPITSSDPVKWAAERLRNEVLNKGVACEIVRSPEQPGASTFHVVVASRGSSLASTFPQAGAVLSSPESLRLAPGRLAESPATLVSATGQRGFIYGLLELAERVQFASDPASALHLSTTFEEEPRNAVRSIARAFCSELEDKTWYYDQDFWRGYLDLLAASRFNRFSLTLGVGYDFPRGVTGDYFHFPYPYLVDVPGYDVRVVRLGNELGEQNLAPFTADEREKNLQMLRFIAAETGARGLQFQLGLWTHAYEWTDSPKAHHRIEGLTPETHAAYCRDALAILLKECPQIQGLTLRVHGESGIPEGSYPFWKTLFEAISGCGRTIEIDMHAKGVNQIMIDMAADTGMPVKLGAKYSAEHQSLGYNQADIRELEIPQPDRMETGVFSVSNGARRFTRYGYADFLRQGSRYQLLFRLWPGTQRHLLSCDPEMAAAFGRTSSFCGAAGLDIFEPLTFKGREGSGLPGGRCAYADSSLTPKAGDYEKFEYFYRVWGRCLYNPDANAESWRRYLTSQYGRGAHSAESALANASRVLPLITSAHLPSASNHAFWAEIYDNMPIVLGSERSPYSDTPTPKCFGTVSPLDPQLFSTVVEHAGDLLAGRSNAKYSPIEVAQWLEDYTAVSNQALTNARVQAKSSNSPEFRRMEEDVLIQIGLGRFFAAKLRSGVLFEIYQQTGSAEAGNLALAQYKKGREAWSTMALRANKVYRTDITYGDIPMRRGNWADRLPKIDRDIAAMQEKLRAAQPASAAPARHIGTALRAATGKPSRPSIACVHTPPATFHPGQVLPLSLGLPGVAQEHAPSNVHLYYRHVNQGERWLTIEMESDQGGYGVAIPASYTDSVYPLQYYFALQRGSDAAWLYPAFNPTLSNQPYYAISKRSNS